MESTYVRECPNNKCYNKITYKYLGDVRTANKKNTICNDCRYQEIHERNQIIVDYLKNTELTHKEISQQLNISSNIITHVRKKYNIVRKPKLSNVGRNMKSKNFKKNILDNNLNIFGGIKTKEHYEKIFKSRFNLEYSDFKLKQPEFKKYYNKVRNITNKNLRKYNKLFNNLDNLGRCGDNGKYQIDHNFSIKEGFRQNVVPELIGHPSNLRIIKWEDNLSKSDNCDITINELITNTSLFLTQNHKIII